MVGTGDTAPDFALRGYHDGTFDTFRLYDELDAGKHVLLTFYYADFSPVCSRQLCEYSDADWYQYKSNLSIFGISRDGPYSHKRFAEENDLSLPLLSDIEGTACEAYDALDRATTVDALSTREDEVNDVPGMPCRSVFLVEPDRTISYEWQTEDNWESPAENPIQEAIRVL